MDDAALPEIHGQYHALEEQGLRVLGIAWRNVSRDHPHAVVNYESELVLAGFAAFLDPPKAAAASALKELQQLGIAIKIVTGDSDLVTRHLCVQLDIPVQGVLTGQEIAQLDDHALRVRERDLHVLHAGVLEGRRTFGNIMKYIMMGTSSNFGNIQYGRRIAVPAVPADAAHPDFAEQHPV